jgi:hypothetical protein
LYYYKYFYKTKEYREDDESFDSDITEAQQYFYKEVERLRQEG